MQQQQSTVLLRYLVMLVLFSLMILYSGCGTDNNGPTQPEQRTIAQIIMEDTAFSTLATAVQAAGLADTLGSEGPFTVFAPVNRAFDNLSPGTLESLVGSPELESLILYHVADDSLPAMIIIAEGQVRTLRGLDIRVRVVNGAIVLNDTATLIIPDRAASNGIIHGIDEVLFP